MATAVSADSGRADAGAAGTVVPTPPASAPRAVHTIADLRPGDHVCSLYESDEEHRAVLTPFLRQGLERGEKVVYIADARGAERVPGYLQDAGLDLAPYRSSKQLVTIGRDDATLRDGLFDPVGMFNLARAEVERAAAEGFAVVRVAEDRTWAQRGLPSSVRLTEFEKLLDGYLHGAGCLALCLYDRRRFEAATLLDMLPSHPWVAIGAEVCENHRYMPADDVPSAERPAAELRRWLRSLIERKRADDALTQEQFLMQTLMSNIPDTIYFKDRDSKFIRGSKALAELFGLSDAGDLVGKSDFDFFSEEHARQAYDDEQAIIRVGQPLTKEERETWADRPDRWVSSTKVPLRDAAGNPIGTFGISRDITAHKRAEAESERLIGELRDALSQVERMSALLPICTSCKKVRDDKEYRSQVESFIQEHADVVKNGLCPECARKLHPASGAAKAATGG